jgi:microcystin degradation protein MlrC
MRHEIATPYLTVDQALDRAEEVNGTVVIADVADNAGGGAPSDSSFVLARIIARGIRNVALGYVWDPTAVWLCQEAGEGAIVDLRIAASSDPLPARRSTFEARCAASSRTIPRPDLAARLRRLATACGSRPMVSTSC